MDIKQRTVLDSAVQLAGRYTSNAKAMETVKVFTLAQEAVSK